MARSTTSRSRSQSDSRAGTFLGIDHSVLSQYVRVFTWLGFLGGIAAAWAILQPLLTDYATEHQRIEQIDIRLPDFPLWLQVEEVPEGMDLTVEQEELQRVKQRIVREITLAAQSRAGIDRFDWQSLEDARRALESTGWFRELKRVERTGPDVVEVDGKYVTPFTMVRSGAWNHLVNRDGRLLPLKYPCDFRMKSLPVIVGARFSPPSSAGERWEGKDVEAGLRLATEMQDTEWIDQIAEIDIAEFLHTETLWLTTTRGARILWGRVPGEERGREVPARQKLAYLDWFHRNHGKVEGIYSEIDLATDRVFAR